MIVIEVLNRLGKVTARTQHATFPVRIGRAYDNNDVILDDEYVSPSHASLEMDEEGRIRIIDLNSENGLYLMPAKNRIAQTIIDQEGLFRLGHTTLRIRTDAFVVTPTKADTEYLLNVLQAFNDKWTAAGIMVLTVIWVGFEVYWNSFTKSDWGELSMFLIWTIVIVTVWAGSWSLMSKISQHHYNFRVHSSIACLALLASSVFDVIYEYYAFAFSGGWSSLILWWGGYSVLLGVLLLGHLRLCTAMDSKRLALNAGGVAVGIMGVMGFSWSIGSSQFFSVMSYQGELKPPAFQVTESLTLDEFFSQSERLKKKIDVGIREESQTE